MSEWFHMHRVESREFALLSTKEAAEVLWNLIAWQGNAVGVIRELELLRQRKAADVIDGIMAEL